MQDNAPLTVGVDHVGLAVKDLGGSHGASFVIALAGESLVRTKVIRRRSCQTETAS